MSYGGNVNRGPFLNIIDWVFVSIALVIVFLRLLSSYIGGHKEAADLFIIFAMAVNFARAVYNSNAIHLGFGRHLDVLLGENPVKTTETLRFLVILQAIGLWTFSLPKFAVVALLVRIFNTSKRVTIIFYASAIALLTLVLALTIINFRKCTPVAFNWDPEIPGGKCWNPNINLNLGYLAGAYSATLDFAFAIYPILQISKLQMERSRKVIVCASLSLGFIAGITTIYKLTLIKEITDTQDPTWATIPLEVWNTVEGTTLIMAASIPLTRPILRIISQGFLNLPASLSSLGRFSGSRRTGESGTGERTGDSSADSKGRIISINPLTWTRKPSVQQPQSKDDILLLETKTRVYPYESDDGHPHSQNADGIYHTREFHVNSEELLQETVTNGRGKQGKWQGLA